MKSAFELAMERLAESDPDGVKPLTDDQRSRLADIDERYDAKVAEKEVFLQKQILEAKMSGDGQALEQLQKQLSSEKSRLNEKREFEKDAIRKESE